MDQFPAVQRVDDLCDFFTKLSRQAAAHAWPPQMIQASAALARSLEQLAGELDAVDDRQQLRALLNDARQSLPGAFVILGRAVAETLSEGAPMRRTRGPVPK